MFIVISVPCFSTLSLNFSNLAAVPLLVHDNMLLHTHAGA